MYININKSNLYGKYILCYPLGKVVDSKYSYSYSYIENIEIIN